MVKWQVNEGEKNKAIFAVSVLIVGGTKSVRNELLHFGSTFCVYFVYPFLRQKKFNYPLMAGHYHYYAKMSESSANPINLILILHVLARVFSLYDF